MAGQLLSLGTCRGFAPRNPDMAIISNGQHTVYAYIQGNRSAVKIGATYSVYKVDNMYYLGNKMVGGSAGLNS